MLMLFEGKVESFFVRCRKILRNMTMTALASAFEGKRIFRARVAFNFVMVDWLFIDSIISID